VSISLNISECHVFSDAQKLRLVKALHKRLDQEGALTVVCQEHRSQYANRQAAGERMAELLRKALKPPRPANQDFHAKVRLRKRWSQEDAVANQAGPTSEICGFRPQNRSNEVFVWIIRVQLRYMPASASIASS
jgi:hypothetical protein